MNNLKTFNPLVSIIINCFNGEKYLETCIDSVINQTYKNWEVIFWDNKSTDKSEKIIKAFSDKRIKYFKSDKFCKLYEARNLAIEKANGELISFLDVDDWWSYEKLSLQVERMQQDKASIIYSNFFQFYQNSQRKIIFSKQKLPTGFTTQDLLDTYSIGILTVLIDKDVLKKKKFNKNYEIIGDFDFMLDISKTLKFACVQKPLAFYRIHSDNQSIKKFDLEKRELENWIKIEKKNFDNFSINGVLDRIQTLNIKIDISSGKRISALKKIFRLKNNTKKIKYFFSLLIPSKILNFLIS